MVSSPRFSVLDQARDAATVGRGDGTSPLGVKASEGGHGKNGTENCVERSASNSRLINSRSGQSTETSCLGRRYSAPEDVGRVAVDLGEQVIDGRGRSDLVVLVEA